MYSKQFAEQSKQLLSALDVEKGSHAATMKCLDAMGALAMLHRFATDYAVAAQQSFETDLEVEDGVGSQSAAEFDAKRKAEAKQAFEEALGRFNRAIARLEVCDPS